jgi:hypothetical protein
MVQHYLLVREGRAMPILFCLKEKKQGRRRGIGWMDFTAEMQKGEKKKTRPPCVERSTSGERRTASLLLFFCFVVVVGVALRGNHFLAAKKKRRVNDGERKKERKKGAFHLELYDDDNNRERKRKQIIRDCTPQHSFAYPSQPRLPFPFFPSISLSPSVFQWGQVTQIAPARYLPSRLNAPNVDLPSAVTLSVSPRSPYSPCPSSTLNFKCSRSAGDGSVHDLSVGEGGKMGCATHTAPP